MTTSENKQGTLATLAGAAGDFVREWRTLAGIEVFVLLLSFAVITPMSEALLRMLVSRSGNAAVARRDKSLKAQLVHWLEKLDF